MSAASRAGHVARSSERLPLSNLPSSLSRVAVALVLLLTIGGSLAALQGEKGRARTHERVVARSAAAALDTVLRSSGGSLLGVQALGSDGVVSKAEFDAFAAGVVTDSDFHALAYLPVVQAKDRRSFEESIHGKIRDRPDPEMATLVAAQTRKQYVPVEFVYPETSATARVRGFDYLADSVRGPAVMSALVARAPRATAPQLAVADNAPNIIIVQPIFDGADAASHRVLGFIAGSLLTQPLGDKVRALLPSHTALSIVNSGTKVYASQAHRDAGWSSASLTVLGRSYTVSVDAKQGTTYTWPALILLAGLSVAGFLSRTFRVAAARDGAMLEAVAALDRAHRSTSALQELTAELSGSASSSDMAQAITRHLRGHEPGLRGSAVIMVGDGESFSRDEHSVDGIPQVMLSAIIDTPDPTDEMLLRGGAALFGLERGNIPGINNQSVAILPLVRGKETVAVITVLFHDPQRFESEQRLRLAAVAAFGSQSLERALRYDEQHAMATTLQRSLLPRTLPEIKGVSIGVRYIPATETALVGGDWYDAFAVSAGLAVVVGDAVGHGVEAASAMGQIRSATRVAMLAGSGPSSALAVLDTFVEQVPGASDATAVFAVMDIDRRELRLARAGHIPPLLVRRGKARFIEDGGSLPLGWAEHSRSEATIDLELGDVLVMLTDGVVEMRSETMQSRFDLLASICEKVADDIEGLCDAIITGMDIERPSDDVALVVVRLDA